MKNLSQEYRKFYAKIGFRVDQKGNVACCQRKRLPGGKLKIGKGNKTIAGKHL